MKKLLPALLLFLVSNLLAQLNPEPLQIPMRDGKSLAADLYRPSQQGNFPVILIQTPYNKNLFQLGMPLGVGQNITASNYAFVVLDWRCFYGSTAACTPAPKRGEDGYDAVEWIADQSWCNGKVGTWGLSALGNIQFETAREQPPHLVCAMPMVASPNTAYYQYFPGGTTRPEYLQTLGFLFGSTFSLVFNNPYYNLVWQFAENTTMYPQDIEVPMLMVAGWFDHNINDDVLLFDTLRALSPVANDHRLLIGPWRHGGLGLVQQGDLAFPAAVNGDDIAGNQFFAHYLLGEDNGWEDTPFVQYFQMGDNDWQTAEKFPPTGLGEQVLYFTENKDLVPVEPFAAEAALNFSYNPNDPSPTIGGKTLSPLLLQGPYDQAPGVESRNDALVFSTAILQENIVVKGKIKAHLFVSSDRKDTDVALRLTEVYPDGKSVLLNETIQRMRFRNGYAVGDTAFMLPGEVYPITLVFDYLANTFKAGNRLRLTVTSSNYPRYNRNMNTGGEMYPNNSLDTLVNPLIAQNSLHVQGIYASRLEIPVEETVNAQEEAGDLSVVFVYPNPAVGGLFLENLPIPSKVWLTNAQGILVKTLRTNVPNESVQVGPLTPGIYYLIVENGQGKRWIEKVFISR
ncbi:MAG: CocE/NonD family hydrolase [Saprospiraceae bacterium]